MTRSVLLTSQPPFRAYPSTRVPKRGAKVPDLIYPKAYTSTVGRREDVSGSVVMGRWQVYAAEHEYDLAFTQMLEELEGKFPSHFEHYITLNEPPLGWTEVRDGSAGRCMRRLYVKREHARPVYSFAPPR
jgi:hypothetical protein